MKFRWLYKSPDSIKVVAMGYLDECNEVFVYRDDGYYHESNRYGDDFILKKEYYQSLHMSLFYSYEEMLEGLKKFLVKEML